MKKLNTLYIHEASDGIRRWSEAGLHFRNIYHILIKLKCINRKLVIKTITQVANK